MNLGWTVVCGVYMPLGPAKLTHWASLIDLGRRSDVDVFMGDFNTGSNGLDKDPKGSRFVGPELPARFIESGYVDVWRSAHPDIREYSWFSPRAHNGFRLDYAFVAQKLSQRVTACEFDHAPRLLRETDHAALAMSMARR